jgi:hypothetical protein
MQAEVVRNLVEAVVELDLAAADRSALSYVAESVAGLRRWLDGVDVAVVRRLCEVDPMAEQTWATASRTSTRDADRVVQRGRTAEQISELGAALADGEVSGAHVDAVTDVLRSAEPDARAALVAEGAWIARCARETTPAELRRELHAHRRAFETDSGMDRLERQRRDCRLTSWVDRNGMWCFRGRFDPETGLKLHQRILTQTQAQFAEHIPEGAPDDPIERQSFLRALALDALTRGAGRSGPPEMTVVIDTTVTDINGGPTVDWALPVEIPVQVLHDLFPEARVCPVIVRNGVVLFAPGTMNLGRTSRLANRDQRRVLRSLYPTCAIPGCEARFELCKIHHVIWWEHDGLTDLDNLLPVCVRHHHRIHDGGWELKLTPDRQLTITYPNGQTQTTRPRRRRC